MYIGAKLTRGGLVMVNFDWAMGCPDIWLNIIFMKTTIWILNVIQKKEEIHKNIKNIFKTGKQ